MADNKVTNGFPWLNYLEKYNISEEKRKEFYEKFGTEISDSTPDEIKTNGFQWILEQARSQKVNSKVLSYIDN
jgi:hypothetical protein